MTRSLGKTGRDVRKLVRELGYKANASNVDRMAKAIRLTRQEYERQQALGREITEATGRAPTIDAHGRDVEAEVKRRAGG